MCLPVSAANITPIIERVTMNLYGDASYVNGMPVPAGTIIIAKDQFGSEIGKYITREIGKYGKEYSSDKFEIGVWRNQSDKINRTLPIRILFTIGGSPAKNILDFKQNDNIRYDITSQSTESIQVIPKSTTTITAKGNSSAGTNTLGKIQPTPKPIIVDTPTTVITELPTTVTIQPQTAQTPTPQTQPTQLPDNPENTAQLIYYGIIGTVVVIAGIIIAGAIYLYIMNKTSRDDVMQQDGKWKK